MLDAGSDLGSLPTCDKYLPVNAEIMNRKATETQFDKSI
jgi:hypothetical protein